MCGITLCNLSIITFFLWHISSSSEVEITYYNSHIVAVLQHDVSRLTLVLKTENRVP